MEATPGETTWDRGLAGLYPAGIGTLDRAALAELEAGIGQDLTVQMNGGVHLSLALTRVARKVIGLRPRFAFGYCLGDVTMLCAFGLFRDPETLHRRRAAATPDDPAAWREREAVCRAWGLPPRPVPPIADRWETHLLLAAPGPVGLAVRQEPRVYVTIVNSPGQTVIAGNGEGCRRIIARLGCRAMAIPFNLPLHCAAVASARPAIAALHRFPVTPDPSITFLTGSEAPLPQDSDAISQAVAQTLTNRVDFPASVQAAYDRGARVFVELGARQMCSAWIDETLGARRHVSIPMDLKGVSSATAQLVAHRIPVDLATVFRHSAGP